MTEPTDRETHTAVIGMAGRFAGAADLAAYWRVISTGACTVRALTTAELLAAGEDPQRMADPAYVRNYGKLDRAEWFDAEFFGYAPVDAMLTDPQHRVFLESCWQALEHAGYPPSATDAAGGSGPTVGVYAGCGQSRYWALVGQQRDRFPGLDDVRMAMVAGADHLCLRVSHKLGLTGPSMTVLTTCSTALVAVHQACQALLVGDCDMALAGGLSVRVPARGALARVGSVLSPDGVCRAFDAKANGTVFGDGAGVVVLKRLADAIADGDHVHAVIRGSAVNNDGRDRVGYGAPGVSGQAAVIRAAMTAAGVEPGAVDYVEGHGTGTQVGDPIEVTALTKAFGPDAGPCVLGSVKPNIGHTDAAAGIAGLLKVILALQHRVLPPSANFEEPNPLIDFAASPFRIQTEASSWPASGRGRRAGVSSFGIGATNVHVVVEEAPSVPRAEARPSHQLIVVSARTAAALRQAAADLAAHLAARPEQPLGDVAFTLQRGRVAFPYRSYAVVTEHADAVRVLTGESPDRLVTAPGPVRDRVAGQGGDPGPADRAAGGRSAGAAGGVAGSPSAGQHAVPPAGAGVDATDLAARLDQAGRRWLAGEPDPWPAAPGSGHRPRRVALPTYPFQRRRHVVDPPDRAAAPEPQAHGPSPGVDASLTPPVAAPPAVAAQPAQPATTAGAHAATPAVATGWSLADIVDTVALLFAEVLQAPQVGAHDDFFVLGGDSLIAVGLIARIEETFGVSPEPEAVFAGATPAGVAEVIRELIEGDG